MTGVSGVTANDLTTQGEPSIYYYKELAKKQKIEINKYLGEIAQLNEQVGALQEVNRLLKEENCTFKQVLSSSKDLEVILQDLSKNEESPGNKNTGQQTDDV